MTRTIIFLAIVACGYGQPAERPVASPVPVYEIKRVRTKITVDGRIDEAAWKEAGTIALQFPWEKQTGAKQKTIARLLWDDANLHVAYECDDADIVAHHQQHDDPTYEDDAVEIFINPDPKHDNYIGLEMNARAVLFDYLYVYPHVAMKSVDLKGVRLAAHLRGTLNLTSDADQGWTLEVAIPLNNFSEFMRGRPVAAGAVWRANVNRWDGTAPNRRLSVWSDSAMVSPNPHNPKRFGQLVFVD
ncbi:MAG: carbohydrate-binding family 9-like protein [Opitutaceae bacterium]